MDRLHDFNFIDTSGILNSHDFDESVPEEDVNLPPKDDLQILLNRIEMQLPKDDHVKYDSRYVSFHFKYSDAEW